MTRVGQALRRGGSLVRTGAALLVAIAPALAPKRAFAAEEQELEAARTRLAAGNYEEAEPRLRRLLDSNAEPCPKTVELTPLGCRLMDVDNIQQARGYYAIALVSNGKKDEAKAQVDEMLRHDPSFTPSPTLYPPDVVDLFTVEKGRLADELAKIAEQKAREDAAARAKEKARKEALEKYIAALEDQAKVETVLETRSRWIAAIPFGVGQYQNGNTGLGVLFSIAEGISCVTMITTEYLAQDLDRQAIDYLSHQNTTQQGLDLNALSAERTVIQGVNIGGAIALGIFAIAGVIEAEAAFKPTAPSTRPRKLPPRPPELEVTDMPAPPAGTVGTTTGLGLRLHF